MNIEVSDLFKVKTETVYNLFTVGNLTTGFSIPEYQRIYSWDIKHIDRIIDDIREGIVNIKNDSGKNESITFVGTVICSNLESNTSPSSVLSIIDGQQRLTTLILICAILHYEVSILSKKLEANDVFTKKFIDDVIVTLLDNLFAIFSGQYGPRPKKHHEYFPRIIREENDKWNKNPKERYYISPVTKFLFEYIKLVIDDQDNLEKFTEITDKICESESFFKTNIDRIRDNVVGISNGELFGIYKSEGINIDPIPSHEDILTSSRYRSAIVSNAISSSSARSLINNNKSSKYFPRLIRLVALSNYIIERVAVIQVTADTDNYAFDIFEALNTAGEPLTALETFKPVVFREEERLNIDEGFSRSTSKNIFDELTQHLESEHFDTSDKRQRESKEIVVSLALVIDGRKESLQLNSQRKYLRTRYEKLQTLNEKQSFVKEIGNIVSFRSEFWDKSRYQVLFNGLHDRDLLLFCMDFIREMKTTMSIPILARYYENANKNQNEYNEFVSAAKATTAFIVLWRSFYGGTNQIDTKFRELMKSKFCKGKHIKNKLPPASELKKEYRRILDKKDELKLTKKETWVSGVVVQPLYEKQKVLCKFLLLLYTNDSESIKENSFLLRKGRANTTANLLTLDKWRANEFSTLEHIAPQNPGENSAWDGNIYNQPYIKNSIGNLILMPQKENSSVGNLGWDIKKVYYSAFSETTPGKVNNHIEDAKKRGFDFKKTTISLIQEGECLPSLKAISTVNNWDKTVITNRSENIAQLSFDALMEWLK